MSKDATSQHVRKRSDFLIACQVIGGVAASSVRYQDAMYLRVDECWRTMTVEQLLDAIEDESAKFDRMMKIARGEA